MYYFFPCWLFNNSSCFVFSFSFAVAVVNEYAMKGLDKVEENLPILQQPADQVKPRLTYSTFESLHESL